MLLSLEKGVELEGLARHLIKLSISQPYTFASLEISEINMILKQAALVGDKEDQIEIHKKLSETVMQYDRKVSDADLPLQVYYKKLYMLCYWTALCEKDAPNDYSQESEEGLWESI